MTLIVPKAGKERRAAESVLLEHLEMAHQLFVMVLEAVPEAKEYFLAWLDEHPDAESLLRNSDEIINAWRHELRPQVSKHTRAGKAGKEIVCPHCGQVDTAFHFAWTAKICQCCDRVVGKYEYLLADETR